MATGPTTSTIRPTGAPGPAQWPVLALAAKGRAFRSLDTLTVRQGGHHLLYGSALALAAGGLAWARRTRAELAELTATVIR